MSEGAFSFEVGRPGVRVLCGRFHTSQTSGHVVALMGIPSHVGVTEMYRMCAPLLDRIRAAVVMQPVGDSGRSGGEEEQCAVGDSGRSDGKEEQCAVGDSGRSDGKEEQYAVGDSGRSDGKEGQCAVGDSGRSGGEEEECGVGVSGRSCIEDGEYGLLVELVDSAAALSFLESVDGKRFTELEDYRCEARLVSDIMLEGHGEENGSLFPLRLDFMAQCPVCLESLLGGTDDAVLSILCTHTFHFRCLSRWTDSTCPVCRFIMTPVPLSRCEECSTSEDLWICLVCGHAGCGRYAAGHAVKHYELSGHTFSLDVVTRKVWDYVGDNFVHRIAQNRTDGKLVALSRRESYDSQGERQEHESRDLFPSLQHHSSLKMEELHSEYAYVLSSQMQQQREYFEKRLDQVRRDCKGCLDKLETQEEELKEQIILKEQKEAKLIAELTEIIESNDQMSKTFKTRLQDLSILKRQTSEMLDYQQRRSQQKKEFIDERKEEYESCFHHKKMQLAQIKDDLRDLELHMKAKKTIQKQSPGSTQIIVMDAPPEEKSKQRKRITPHKNK